MAIIEVEVANDQNAGWAFLAIGRNLRGRLDLFKVNEAEALKMSREYPNGIPGQRVQIDTEAATATIVEPLHEPAYAEIRAKIEKRGLTIAAAREEVTSVDLPTALFWVKRAIESGTVKLVRGTIPQIEGKPRKRFISPEEEDPREADRVLRRQEIAAKLAMMTPQQRKEYEKLLNGTE